MKNHREYYTTALIYNLIPKLKVPTLIIGSDNDPFTEAKYQPVKEVKESQNVAMIIYPEGGHVSFLTGIEAKESIVDKIGIEYFSNLIDN